MKLGKNITLKNDKSKTDYFGDTESKFLNSPMAEYLTDPILYSMEELEKLETGKGKFNYLKSEDYDNVYEMIQKDFKEKFGKDIPILRIENIVKTFIRDVVFFLEKGFEVHLPTLGALVKKKKRKKDTEDSEELE